MPIVTAFLEQIGMKKEVLTKIQAVKALQGKTVQDITEMPEFRANLEAYWKAQKDDRDAIKASYKAMRKLGGAKGYKLPAHTIDHLAGFTVDDIIKEFRNIFSRRSKCSAAEREYIEQLGMQAYNLTIAQIAVAEFPELKDELFPKAN